MSDERARMLQDQFNVSMNHVHALAILVSTFYHGKDPPAIDQVIFFHNPDIIISDDNLTVEFPPSLAAVSAAEAADGDHTAIPLTSCNDDAVSGRADLNFMKPSILEKKCRADISKQEFEKAKEAEAIGFVLNGIVND
ncbi:hypothetical protein LXL04_027722 [Taraxacum kok-saghyz]